MLELGFKLEMMLGMSFLLIGGKKNDLEELFSMYSEKYLCEYFTLAVIFSTAPKESTSFKTKARKLLIKAVKHFFIALPTSEELDDVIGTLINGKSTGPNNISTFIFQKIKEISQSLSVLINKSFKNSIIRNTQNNTSCRSIEN